MPDSQIKLYYKNVTAQVIGAEHGITPDQLKELDQKTSPLISKLNDTAISVSRLMTACYVLPASCPQIILKRYEKRLWVIPIAL